MSAITLRPPPGQSSFCLLEARVEADVGDDNDGGPLHLLLLHNTGQLLLPPGPGPVLVIAVERPYWAEDCPGEGCQTFPSSQYRKHRAALEVVLCTPVLRSETTQLVNILKVLQ